VTLLVGGGGLDHGDRGRRRGDGGRRCGNDGVRNRCIGDRRCGHGVDSVAAPDRELDVARGEDQLRQSVFGDYFREPACDRDRIDVGVVAFSSSFCHDEA
jgi:hypothetical protein